MALNPNMALPVDIVHTAGQSNMQGTPGASIIEPNPPSPTATAGLTWEYRSAGTNFLPIAEGASGFSTESTYRANNGSCIPSFVNTVVAASGRSIVVVRAAVGGTALLASNNGGQGHWDVAGSGRFADSVTRLNDCIADVLALGHTIGKVFVIWSQGGRDAIGGNNLHLYQAANAALVQRWRTATGISDLQMFMEELSSVQGGEGSLAPNIATIRAAQNAACASTDGLHMAFNEGKDYVNRPGWMRNADGIHYMQVGLNYMGYQMGLFVNDHYGFSAPVDPPDPTPETPERKTSLIAHRLRFNGPLPTLPVSWMAPGTYTWLCPFGVTSIKLEGWGYGGSGRGGVSLGRGGMSGGSGEYRVITTLAVTPGVTYTIVIPSGGVGSTYNTNDGTNGSGDMTFSDPGGVILRCKGGQKPASASAVGIGGTGGSGGTGTDGTAGNASVNTSGSDGAAGVAAPGGGGAGGAGGVTGDILGKPGSAPGGSGGGGKGNVAGANGGNGSAGGCKITAA